MTPTDTYKKSVEEFEKLGGEDLLDGFNVEEEDLPEGHLTSGYEWPESKFELDPDKVIEFIKSHTIALLEGEIAELEGEKSPYRPNDSEYYNDKHRECGWEAFRKKQINRLQAEVDVIKSL